MHKSSLQSAVIVASLGCGLALEVIPLGPTHPPTLFMLFNKAISMLECACIFLGREPPHLSLALIAVNWPLAGVSAHVIAELTPPYS